MVYGYSLPSKWEVKVSRSVPMNREALFNYLCTIRNWEKWTAWNNDDGPKFEFSYEGPESGKGALQSWKSGRQSGKTMITGTEVPQNIEYEFAFGFGQHSMKGRLELEEAGEGTMVTWTAFGDSGNALNKRILARMFSKYILKDFEAGLERLAGMKGQLG